MISNIPKLTPTNSNSNSNKSKSTFDVFATLEFVDSANKSTMSSGNCYRTNSVDITSLVNTTSNNTTSSSTSSLGRVFSINWSQESIFDSHTGVLRAVYAHIEVWCIIKTSNGVTSTETSYLPLGEVYLPLKQLTEKYVELKLPLLWTPKMPLEYKDEYENFGFIVVGAKVIRGEEFPSNAELELNSSICLAPATSSQWIARPIYDNSTTDQLNDINDSFFVNCCGSSFQITSYESEIEKTSWKKYISKSMNHFHLQKSDSNHYYNHNNSTNNSNNNNSNQSGGIMKTLSANIGRRLSSSTTSHPSLQIVNSQNFNSIEGSTLHQIHQVNKSKLHSSYLLKTSIESQHQQRQGSIEKVIQIPWNQILNVTLASDSSLIIKFEIHSQPSSSSISISNEEKSNQLETIEFQLLIGPCPAKR